MVSVFAQLHMHAFILILCLPGLEEDKACLSKLPCQLASCPVQPMGHTRVRLQGRRTGEPSSSTLWQRGLKCVTTGRNGGEASIGYWQVCALAPGEASQTNHRLFNGTMITGTGWWHTFVSAALREVAVTFSSEFGDKTTFPCYSSRSSISL